MMEATVHLLFFISISDGILASTPAECNVTFTPDNLVFVTNQLTIRLGETLVITTNNLKASNAITSAITFTISNLKYGTFARTDIDSVTNQFTQDDILNSKIKFVQDGSKNAPCYSVSVTDGVITSSAIPANITFCPNNLTVISNQISFYTQGESVVLSSNNLLTSSFPGLTIYYVVSKVKYARFESSTSSAAIYQFTQTQINNGDIIVVADGTCNKTCVTLTVSDGSNVLVLPPTTVNWNVICGGNIPTIALGMILVLIMLLI